MAESGDSTPEPMISRREPARTPEEQEMRLIALANEVAEQQMREGKASAQVISHFLKMGSSREQKEQTRLVSENELLRAKANQIESEKDLKELFEEAMAAMKSYQGETPKESDDD